MEKVRGGGGFPNLLFSSKKMTGQTLLTGVYPSLRPHLKLLKMYRRTHQLLQKLPTDAAYKINTEAIICHKMKVVQDAGDDIREIEDNLRCGMIEMLISQAEAEFFLVQKMLTWKPWEPLMERPPRGQWDWPPANV